MSAAEQVLWWCAFLAGLIGTAVFSGLETGLYFLNRVKLEVRAAHGPRRRAARMLKREIERPQRLLASNLIANAVCGDLAATAASELLAARGYPEGAIVAINAALLTPVFFVLLETIPKELFRLESDRLTYSLAWVLSATRTLLTAVGALAVVRAAVRFAGRILGGEADAGLAATARDRIITMLKDTTAAGVLSESQAGLLDRAVAFQQTLVGEEMTPWARIRTIPGDWSREQAARLLAREPHSYWPILERKPGASSPRVLGVLRHQDLFLRPGAPPAALALQPARLPARMRLPEAVQRLRDAQAPVGIIEDGGRPIGMVTMADLVEPLTGVGA